MQIETRKTVDLIPYARNSNKHSEKQVGQIAASIKEFGFTNPILIDETNEIIAGHGRVLAALKLKLDEVPCVVLSGLTKAQKRAYVIIDNQLAKNSEWDIEMLSLEIADLKIDEFDLGLLGFEDDFLTKFEPEVVGETDPDSVPENVETRVKRGDLWILGNHRLICGDSTDILQVERLMNNEKADMVFTDPPYGISLDRTKDSEKRSGKMPDGRTRTQKNYKLIEGDNERFDPNFILQLFSYCEEIFLWGGNHYCHSLPESPKASWIVWDRKCTESADKALSSDFELCWVKKPHKYSMVRVTWHGPFGHNKKTDGESRVHPTQKPVKLAEEFFTRWGNGRNLIVDLFLGSGSTLIACEKTNRRCFGMEVDPHYVSIILERWEKFTGKKAILETR